MKRLLSECCLREVEEGVKREYPLGGTVWYESFRIWVCECCGNPTETVYKDICEECGVVVEGECLECQPTASVPCGTK